MVAINLLPPAAIHVILDWAKAVELTVYEFPVCLSTSKHTVWSLLAFLMVPTLAL